MIGYLFASCNLHWTLLFPIEREEQAFKKFHEQIHLRVIRVPILLMAILCLPVALLQEDPFVMGMVFCLVVGPCICLFVLSFTTIFHYRILISVFFFVASEVLIYTFSWLLHTNSAIIFYFVLHFIHLTAFLRFFYGALFSVLFHIVKIANDFSYQAFNEDVFDWRTLIFETLIEILSHCCFLFIAYKNESTTRSFFRMRNELFFENQESEKLFKNVLPQQAVERLERGEFPVSDRWENATIVLIEVKFSEKVQAETSVLLSEIFYILDTLSSEYGLEKILGFRGDEYMVLSTQEKSSYLSATFSIAAMRQIREYINSWELTQSHSGLALTRIGIGCSTIYGGVVGSEKCTYDYWGDGLTLVQKIVAVCPPDSIAISSTVHKALSKNGLFCFQPIDFVIVPPFGQVELFTLTDPTEEAHACDSRLRHAAVNVLAETFSSKQISSSKVPVYEFGLDKKDTESPQNQFKMRLKINKFTLRFDDAAEERVVTRKSAESSLWQIRVFMVAWALLCSLESIRIRFDDWTQLVVLLPIVAVYEICTFSRKFIDFFEYALLLLAVLVGIHYLYFSYLTPLLFSFFIYPAFLFYLLPLRYIHAVITASAVYLSYGILLCVKSDILNVPGGEVAQQVIALVVVIATYNVAAYHVRERMRTLYMLTDSLAWSKQQVEQRLQVIIPARIISSLRQGQYPIVYNFQDVGIGCVTVTNMQALLKDYSYNQISLMIHNLHQCADKFTSNGIDKIKTIGPLSVVAAGLPTGLSTVTLDDADYMVALGRWALGVIGILNSMSKKHLDPTPTLCVVLHFGEVYAGVVGTKKYHFDLWGTQMAELQKTLDAVKILDQNAIYVTEAAHEVLGKSFNYKPKHIGTTAVFQLVSEASAR